ncbi:MAG TPA: M23 family metallopeptidase [Spirochaetota bacterium]|nr:M23 family metallopeptidase [Spirochaetota bacterium]HPS85348.1 M23 family metallopeptidase [Spirochaetota bacterium]
MYKKIISITLLAFMMLFGIFYSFLNRGKSNITPDMRSYFKTEENYINYLKQNVEFKSVKLNYITVQNGSNFWKIAKEYKINIDTLIGINIFWEDLRAKTSQTVIVPSESGIIDFVNYEGDVTALAEVHGVPVSDLEVQKMPFLYSLYSGFLKERMPVAVFIRDARPNADNMTANLAGKFKQRQMFRSPLGGRLSSFFGNRKHPIYRKTRFHNGLDIAAPHGTFIGAAREGVVVSTGWNGGYGKAVIIQHDDGYKTMYGHMSSIFAKPGEKVKAGKILGRVGSTGLSTGPHLHFTLWHNGKLLNPMDVLW